jgi:hypothetical protein
MVKGRSVAEWAREYNANPTPLAVGSVNTDDGENKTKYFARTGLRQRRQKARWRTYPNHAIRRSPFTDKTSPLNDFTKDLTIDIMHTGDGSVVKMGIGLLLSVAPQDDSKWKLVGPSQSPAWWETCNKYVLVWRRWLPKDFARKPRALINLKSYKMREVRVAAVHLVPALWHVPQLGSSIDKGLFENFMKLVTAMHLVGGFSCKPLPKVS